MVTATGRSLEVLSESLLRDLIPQVLGTVVRRFRDFAAAEDAVQEAAVAAALRWPREGRPARREGSASVPWFTFCISSSMRATQAAPGPSCAEPTSRRKLSV